MHHPHTDPADNSTEAAVETTLTHLLGAFLTGFTVGIVLLAAIITGLS